MHSCETEGRFGEINWPGIDFYNKLFDSLLLKGNFLFFLGLKMNRVNVKFDLAHNVFQTQN